LVFIQVTALNGFGTPFAGPGKRLSAPAEDLPRLQKTFWARVTALGPGGKNRDLYCRHHYLTWPISDEITG
jgi:hypothetical protein